MPGYGRDTRTVRQHLPSPIQHSRLQRSPLPHHRLLTHLPRSLPLLAPLLPTLYFPAFRLSSTLPAPLERQRTLPSLIPGGKSQAPLSRIGNCVNWECQELGWLMVSVALLAAGTAWMTYSSVTTFSVELIIVDKYTQAVAASVLHSHS